VARTVALAAENELGKLARTLGDVDALATPTTPTTPTTSRRKLRSPSSSPAAPLVLDALDELKRIQSFLLRANCEPQ
jgi:Asp-tRNA(Asn)/Glu-tRNA(Gln) amidotransferase A subunit family amidase